MATELNLTEEQRARIRGFVDDARTQIQALRNDSALTRGQRIDRADEIRRQAQENIRSVLTTEQQMKAEELRKQAQERIAARRQQFADRAFDGLARRLNLTESQQTTIKSYIGDQRTQLQALRDNTALTREQRMEQARTIRQQTREKIRSALTADQQQQLDQMRQRTRNRFQTRQRRMFRQGARMRGLGIL
jgi:Spy/CpxP family protein refolding chaperone